MRFIGIWYDMNREIKRDYVDASDVNEASDKLHALYAGRREPGPCLSVVSESWNSQDYGGRDARKSRQTQRGFSTEVNKRWN